MATTFSNVENKANYNQISVTRRQTRLLSPLLNAEQETCLPKTMPSPCEYYLHAHIFFNR